MQKYQPCQIGDLQDDQLYICELKSLQQHLECSGDLFHVVSMLIQIHLQDNYLKTPKSRKDWASQVEKYYVKYVQLFEYNLDLTSDIIFLFKRPFARIAVIAKLFKEIAEVSGDENDIHAKFIFCKIVDISRQKIESEIKNMDMNIFRFNKVLSFDTLKPVSAIFDHNLISFRREFSCILEHSCGIQWAPCEVEALLLKSGIEQRKSDSVDSLVLCFKENPGRALMFPPFRTGHFELVDYRLDVESLEKSFKSSPGSLENSYYFLLQDCTGSRIFLTTPEGSNCRQWKDHFDILFSAEHELNETRPLELEVFEDNIANYHFGTHRDEILAKPFSGLHIINAPKSVSSISFPVEDATSTESMNISPFPSSEANFDVENERITSCSSAHSGSWVKSEETNVDQSSLVLRLESSQSLITGHKENSDYFPFSLHSPSHSLFSSPTSGLLDDLHERPDLVTKPTPTEKLKGIIGELCHPFKNKPVTGYVLKSFGLDYIEYCQPVLDEKFPCYSTAATRQIVRANSARKVQCLSIILEEEFSNERDDQRVAINGLPGLSETGSSVPMKSDDALYSILPDSGTTLQGSFKEVKDTSVFNASCVISKWQDAKWHRFSNRPAFIALKVRESDGTGFVEYYSVSGGNIVGSFELSADIYARRGTSVDVEIGPKYIESKPVPTIMFRFLNSQHADEFAWLLSTILSRASKFKQKANGDVDSLLRNDSLAVPDAGLKRVHIALRTPRTTLLPPLLSKKIQ